MKLRNKNLTVCIWSEDYKKLAYWYEKVLNLQVRKLYDHPNDTGVDFDFGENYFFIGKHDRIKGKSKDPYRIMITFNVPSVSEVYNTLKKKKVKFIAKPFKTPLDKGWMATAEDPEENIIQFYGEK